MRPVLAIVLRGAAAAAVAGIGLAGAWMARDWLAERPLAGVVFTGETARVPAEGLDRLAARLAGRPAGEVALAEVREAVKRLPWVRDCTVRRRFPDTLEVAIEAHAPLARWDDTRLVSDRGEVFTAVFAGDLPRFEGPEAGAADMARAWPSLRDAAAPLGSPVKALRLDARRAWKVTLGSGLTIELGRGEAAARLSRFAAAWPAISAGVAPTHADLRYPNGFALRVPAAPAPKAPGKARRA